MAWPEGDAPKAPPPLKRRFRDLTTRTVAGVALGALAVVGILAGPYGVLVLTGVALGGVAAEWHRLMVKGLPAMLTVTGAVYLLLASFSFCYIYFGPSFDNPERIGRDSLFWFLAVVVANDCFAYGVGRLVGGPRLAPRISPKKTWSGTLGGIAASGAAGAGAGWAFGGANLLLLTLAGLGLGLVAQLGDLAESRIKRHVGVKDAGSIIPGHGGLLDRLDGLAAAAVVLAAAQFVSGSAALAWP